VKTYAHALKLHEERLQDARQRRGELQQAIDRKRLELLELRREQLRAQAQREPALEEQIELVRGRIRGYEARGRVREIEPVRGLIQLRKKTADGIVPVQVATTAAE